MCKKTSLIQGRDLITLGLKPSTEFEIISTNSYKLQMDDHTKEEILIRIENKTIFK